LEEIGVRVIDLEFYDMSEHIEQNVHWIAIGFIVTRFVGTPKNLEPDKHDAVKWWPLDDLPELASYTEVALRKYNGSN